jgi:hypothetical protein
MGRFQPVASGRKRPKTDDQQKKIADCSRLLALSQSLNFAV